MFTMLKLCEKAPRFVYVPVKDGIMQGTIESAYNDTFEKYAKFFTNVEWAYWSGGLLIYIHFEDGTEIQWCIGDMTYKYWRTDEWIHI